MGEGGFNPRARAFFPRGTRLWPGGSAEALLGRMETGAGTQKTPVWTQLNFILSLGPPLGGPPKKRARPRAGQNLKFWAPPEIPGPLGKYSAPNF